jgi:tetratricopeptide (TPR) repeat protein
MRQVFGWMAVALLCCAASTTASEQRPDARLQEAQKAYDEAKRLDTAGKYAEARVQGEQALALREAVLGGANLDVATCLDLLGRIRRHQADYGQAEPLIQRGLALREAALGKNHLDVAQSLNNLAVLYADQGLYAQAEPLYQRALAIREAALGSTHPDVAQSLNNLATLYEDQGLYDRVEPLYQRALAIREAALGSTHPDVAASLNNLATLYKEQGRYDKGGPLLQRALAIWEAALGKNHPLVAAGLFNLGVLYKEQGLYDRVEPLLERALAIDEAALGKTHPLVATILRNIAVLYADQGLYSRAEPIFQRSLALREAALGKTHPDIATSIYSLAKLYSDQGLFDRAVPLYERALSIQEAALGKNHTLVASSLHNLAAVYTEQGLYKQAEPLFQRALAIREEVLGKNNPDVASTLNNMALLYAYQGFYDRAEPLYQRALAIREVALGKNHNLVAESLDGLAQVYAKRGLYSRAEPLYQRALSIQEATFGKSHPQSASLINNFALLKLAQHRLGEAVPLFTRAFAISEQRLRLEGLDFSESRLASFLRFLRTDEERLYALLRAYPDNASVRRLALSAALLFKGRSVEETADISRTIYRSLDAQEHDTFERLRGLRTQLARLYLQGPGSRPLADYQQQLKELTEQGDALEADLAQRSAPLRAVTELPSPADIVDRVAQALPKDGALVEFITYKDRPLEPHAPARSQLRYLALVLLPDATVRVRDLGPAEPMDLAASHLRDALANQAAAYQTHAREVYRLAFQPLLPLLGKTRRLFLSPDGQLALVPFAALHDGHQFLLESFDFTYLSSGKELLPRPQEVAPAASVVVLADPDFGAQLPKPAPSGAEASAPAERSTSLERFFSSLAEEPEKRSWELMPLPGTRQEAEAIQRLLPQAQLFLGAAATKQRLLHLPTPGILHVATHGFFLEDVAAPMGSRAVGHFGALGEDTSAARPPDPLLRSGLLLAGASTLTSSTTGSTQLPPDSSLVTALELAGLNLWGTQLVVLSACDTGRGDIKLGQGVYGLRRSLAVAGAETVVMSLWKVEDQTTSTLMEAYYRNLLAGQGRAAALREAMRELRTTLPHPHFWAPFIALGRDTPLRALAPAGI